MQISKEIPTGTQILDLLRTTSKPFSMEALRKEFGVSNAFDRLNLSWEVFALIRNQKVLVNPDKTISLKPSES